MIRHSQNNCLSISFVFSCITAEERDSLWKFTYSQFRLYHVNHIKATTASSVFLLFALVFVNLLILADFHGQ